MATVIYDADCGFCRWSLALLLSLDRERSGGGRSSPPTLQGGWGRSTPAYALRPLPLGTVEADRLLADLTVDEREASWHLVIDMDAVSSPGSAAGRPGSARFSAGAALAPALALLPGGRAPASLVARMPRLSERGYRWVAGHRGQIGRFVPARARRWADRTIAVHVGPAGSQ